MYIYIYIYIYTRGGGLISVRLYKENNKLGIEKICLFYIFLPDLYTLMTSLV
jgi:hypothetical protein